MKLVIDIPESAYESISSGEFDTDGYFKRNLSEVFRNSTPLPKGHGRLIECERLQEVFRRNVVGYAGFKQLFDIAPTIIEADKEGWYE